MPVKAQPVKVDLVLNEVTAVGSLIADEAVIIRPETAGRVIELPFREGQAVQKGAKLVVIDGSEYDAILAQAKAEAKTETQRYERTIDLFKNKFVSQDAVDVAKAIGRYALWVTIGLVVVIIARQWWVARRRAT